MRIVFWQNLLAFYQLPHIKALSEMGHSVTWVSQEDISEERRTQGWSLPNTANLDVRIAPDAEEITRLVQESPEESVHIFSGINGFPLVTQAFQECIKTSARMGLLIENRDDQGVKGFGRRLQYQLDHVRYGKRISFILVMGYTGKHGGRNWYRSCGYSDAVLFPYGYFVGGPEVDNIPDGKGSQVELLYVGQLVHRKAIDVLLNALAPLRDLNWRLRIIGDGPERNALLDLSKSLGIAEKVVHMPYLKNAEAMEQMAKADVFILPSRFDGWGVVINEALLRGVPVICSDRCGAQDLLQEKWRGDIFVSESVPNCTEVLQRWIAKGKNTSETAALINEWNRSIRGTSAARYLEQVLEHVQGKAPRPSAPWLEKIGANPTPVEKEL